MVVVVIIIIIMTIILKRRRRGRRYTPLLPNDHDLKTIQIVIVDSKNLFIS
jgi:hypothetical protein